MPYSSMLYEPGLTGGEIGAPFSTNPELPGDPSTNPELLGDPSINPELVGDPSTKPELLEDPLVLVDRRNELIIIWCTVSYILEYDAICAATCILKLRIERLYPQTHYIIYICKSKTSRISKI